MVPVRDEATLRRADARRRGMRRGLRRGRGESLYLFAVVATAMSWRGCSIASAESARIQRPAPRPVRSARTSRSMVWPVMPGTVVIAQGELVGRPSFLHVDVAPEGDSLRCVSAGCADRRRGTFRLD